MASTLAATLEVAVAAKFFERGRKKNARTRQLGEIAEEEKRK